MGDPLRSTNKYLVRYKLRLLLTNLKIFHRQTYYEGEQVVAQSVEALRYKSEGRGFDSR
jgi:hypothetical protein